MSRRGQDFAIQQQSSARLYEDTVLRKAGKLQSDEELTMTTARIAQRTSSGEEYVSVVLTGWRKLSSGSLPVAKFEVNMSCPRCSYQISEAKRRITLSYADEGGRLKEEHVLKMKSMQQLRAWAAELIQASTFEPEDTLQRCFHVAVPEMSLEQTEPRFDHFILQARHPNNCELVIRQPLTLSDVKGWDISKLKAFTLEFFPRPLLSFKRTDVHLSVDPREHEESVYFLSAEVAQQALNFIELLIKTRMPKFYLKANRRVFSRQTSKDGAPRAVTFDFQSSFEYLAQPAQRSLSSGDVNSDVTLSPVSCFGIKERVVYPYAVVDLLADLTAPLPPTNLIRPGIVLSRQLDDCHRDYVKMSPAANPPLLEKDPPIDSRSDSHSEDDYIVVADASDDDYENVFVDESVNDCEAVAANESDSDYEVAADEADDDYEYMAAGVSRPFVHNN